MGCLQVGHKGFGFDNILCAHRSHKATCSHGAMTVLNSFSKQMTHKFVLAIHETDDVDEKVEEDEGVEEEQEAEEEVEEEEDDENKNDTRVSSTEIDLDSTSTITCSEHEEEEEVLLEEWEKFKDEEIKDAFVSGFTTTGKE